MPNRPVITEPPYGIIWNRWKAGKVIPFLGAAASFAGRPDGARWDGVRPTFLPSGVELASLLAEEAMFPSTDPRDCEDLAKVSSYYADVSGRSALRERLRQLFNHEYQSGQLHELIAAVPAPQVIVVTNYDTLVEQALLAAGKPYDLVVYPADRKDLANAALHWRHAELQPEIKVPNELDIDLSKTTVVFKMHGTVVRGDQKWDNFVITEEDYIEFLSRMTSNTAIPALFLEHFRERSFLFLGYSLRDWNLRVILKNLSKHFSRTADSEDEQLRSWAIQLGPSELEKKLWERRNVDIFDLGLEQFVTRMSKRRES